MNLMFDIFLYVSNAHFFYSGIGYTIATSMFIGATIYNGDLRLLSKGVVTILSYFFFLFTITFTRLIDIRASVGYDDPVKAYAGLYTLITVTLAYLLGLYAGVTITKIIRKGKDGKKQDR